MTVTPLISIITINYNSLKETCEFLESTKRLTYRNFEIIVVDNASKEDPTKIITSRFPEVKLLVNSSNLGFTGGNNTGMAVAKGDYLFIVNNDTEVTDNLLNELLKPFEQDNSIGVVSPKIKYFDHPNIIQYAGFTEINPITGRNKTIGDRERDQGQHDTPGYTLYAHGAAMFLKKEVVERTGMFADIFFLYYEELDWSARIQRAGFRIYYQPTAVIYHKESISVGKSSTLKTYYLTRNRILFMRRNVRGIHTLIWPLFLVTFSIPKNSIQFFLTGKIDHLKAFWRALIWNIMHLKSGDKISIFNKA
ncbi:MAG: glycosyltransferase family 2 protein [Cyclobacteriaceae bacterium]|nr:MAG: glycosyltransferase family 2 protein [Cyclobacteriaceae bacterium]